MRMGGGVWLGGRFDGFWKGMKGELALKRKKRKISILVERRYLDF